MPDLESYVDVQEFERYTNEATKTCTISSTTATTEEDWTVRLVAAKDICPGDIILSEGHLLQVMTAKPDDNNLRCDRCSTVLVIEIRL